MPGSKRPAEGECDGSRDPKRGKGVPPPPGTIDFRTWTKPATMTFLTFMKDALDVIRQADKTRLEANQAEVEKLKLQKEVEAEKARLELAAIEKLKLQKEVEAAEIEKLKLQREVTEARAHSESNGGSPSGHNFTGAGEYTDGAAANAVNIGSIELAQLSAAFMDVAAPQGGDPGMQWDPSAYSFPNVW
ncbi:hypothetical protein EIP86_006540 [Pleurotus ostreatoroseus]|nr:hypothetical protein EIP86_006540 [Pleurotus ostreatoroseus]